MTSGFISFIFGGFWAVKYTLRQKYLNCEFELDELDINSLSSTRIKIVKHLKSMKTVISYFQMFDKL